MKTEPQIHRFIDPHGSGMVFTCPVCWRRTVRASNKAAIEADLERFRNGQPLVCRGCEEKEEE